MKKPDLIIRLITAVIILHSCGNGNVESTERIEIEEVNLVAETEYKEVIENLSQKPQVFSINNKRDTIIECINGTMISFPQYCFVDENGKPATNVKIEVVEALELSDFIRNDLQTISGDELLESGGMIYINATSKGKQLAIDKNSALNVELPSNYNSSDFKIFNGRHDDDGQINWEESSSLDDRMLPLPLSVLGLKYYTAYQFPSTQQMRKDMDSVIINNPKYENTYIATEEFEERLSALNHDGIAYWQGFDEYIKNPTHESWYKLLAPKDITKSMHCEPIDIYLDNIDKPLWYADSLVYDYLINRYKQDSIAYWGSDETHFKDKWNTTFGWYNLHLFEWFTSQKKKNPVKIDTKGVNIKLPNAKELLMKKGYSEDGAYEQILLSGRVQRIIDRRIEVKRRVNEMIENRNRMNKAFKVAFEVKSLGWVNVDRFLNDSRSQEVVFNLDVLSNPTDYCDLTLIIPSRNLAINGMRDEKGKYSFTKKSGNYRKLPVGERAIVICISSKDNQPYIAMEKITIKKEQTLKLDMKRNSWSEIEKMLLTMNKPSNSDM